MKDVSRLSLVVAGALLVLGATSSLSAKSLGWNADVLFQELHKVGNLPEDPSIAAELKFSEFYRSPVGAQGLEITEKLKGLDGKRVRILGFMVKQTGPVPGTILLAPYAATTHEGEYGLCDDLPPAVLFVRVPKYQDLAVPFTPGPLLLTGTLEVGLRDEPDGRVSFTRLILDPEATPRPASVHAE